ncbi:MAG TPA: 16S rRNA processing protein RimM [Firmicutes bacterium]|nr:16S rRNA processing protein RimM [Bacillota bacterium]
MKEKITVGTLQKPFGLKGEIRAKSMTSFPELRFKIGRHFFLKNLKTEEEKEVILKSFRPSGDYFFVGFEGMDTIEDALPFYGNEIEMYLDEAPLPEGYYRLQDLIGINVIDAKTDENIGKIKDVLSFSAISTIKAVTPTGKNFTFPFLFEKFVVSLDIKKKEMKINVIPGLL